MAEHPRSNPMGTDGFEFVEFTGKDATSIANKLQQLGFSLHGQHPNKAISHFRQNGINFIINLESNSYASQFADKHGESVCAMAFRVADAKMAYQRALSLGAKPFYAEATLLDEPIPAIRGIGDSVLYLVDEPIAAKLYNSQLETVSDSPSRACGLTYIDHLTHNVYRGEMDRWANYYTRLFNFEEIRFFNIQGQETGLLSRAMQSPCGKIRIPLNESLDEHSQIEEFLDAYNGEGIQHIALSTDNIYQSVEQLRDKQVAFLDTPDIYFDLIAERLPWHQEDLARLRRNKILIDGEKTPEAGLLLQIFTENTFGPVFFEVIQRKGNQGFGEGNFQALFEAIERDQIARGVLKPKGEA